MEKEENTERNFSQELDKMLAGEEPCPGAAPDEDYQSAISFAGRLVDSRPEPSPAFKSQLKERLLLKLSQHGVETPEEAKWSRILEGVKRLVPERVILRAAAITSLVAIWAIGILWGAGVFSQPQTTSFQPQTISFRPPLSLPQPPVTVEITTIRSTCPAGGEANCSISETVELAPAPSPGASGPPVLYSWEETTWNFPSHHIKPMEQRESIEYDYYRRRLRCAPQQMLKDYN